jgi:ribonuclease BN (tRNA processing enzyme)
VKLTVIGCAGSAPGPKSPASCYLVEHDGFQLVLDMGNGAFGPLQGYADPASIDAVFLSHLHADHCLDVAPYVVWHRYSGRAKPGLVPLYAPVGAERRLRWPTTWTGSASPTSSTSCRSAPGRSPSARST